MIQHSRFWPLVLVLFFTASCNASGPSEEWIERARRLTKDYQMALQGELMKGMKAGGPAGAISVCSIEAPAIGKRVSRKAEAEGWAVSRTALRVRNPSNRPSDWQTKGLNEIARRIAAGESPEKVDWRGKAEGKFVYMKPIMMGDLCLTCHGPRESIPVEVTNELVRLYPKDEATGFSVGELRGAMIVTGPPG